MANTLSNAGIVDGQTIFAAQVNQIINSLTGDDAYDISISGSLELTGSLSWNGSTDAAGSEIQVVVRDTASGELYTTGSSAFGGGGSTNTGSLYYSSSVNLNTITFYQGDGTTEDVTVDTGSIAVSASYAPNIYNSDGSLTGTRTVNLNGESLTFVADGGESFIINSDPGSDVTITDLATGTQSQVIGYNSSTGQLTAMDTSSFGGTVNTGSLMVTGSVTGNVLTFEKGDGSTFNMTVDTGSGGGSNLNISDEGTIVTSAATKINFVGTIVSASSPAGNTEVTASFFPPGFDTQLIYNSASLFHATSSLTFIDHDPTFLGPVLRVGENNDETTVLFVSGSGSANNLLRVGDTLLANYNTGFNYSLLSITKYGGSDGLFIGRGTSTADTNAVSINNVPIDNVRLYVQAKPADRSGFEVATSSGTNALTTYTGSGGHSDPRVKIQNALVLPPVDPKPTSPEVGTIIVSGSSPARPFMWDGSTWYAM